MCPRPARRPDTHFLRMGREGAHGSESRVEGSRLRSRGSRFLARPSGHRSCRSKSACRVAFPNPFLFLSPSTSSSSARFRIRSWSARPNSVSRRRLPVSAFTFSTAPTTFPILSNRERLEATNVPPTPRREAAAWQPRCFPPLGIDVHGDRSLCVHRQVLRPRRRPFDRVPLPVRKVIRLCGSERPRLFLPHASAQLRLCRAVPPDSEGPLRSTVSTCSRVNFLVGVVTASCGSAAPDKSSKGSCDPLDAGLEPAG